MRRLLLLLILSLWATPSFAALGANTIHHIISGSTAGNVNGGGFNPSNANFLTDFTTDTNTGNTDSAVISSASYNFVAGDDEAWVYVQSGTNWYSGCYFQIDSVASNKATLNTGIGEGFCLSNTVWSLNTVAGISSDATPTGGVLGFNFSQQTASEITATDYASIGSSTTMTSVTGGFRRIMTGNIFHMTTTGTGAFCLAQWFEVVNYTDANTVVTDRTTNNGTDCVGGTGHLGGAFSLNTSSATMGDDDIFEAAAGNGVAGNTWFLKGTLTLGEAVSISLVGTAAAPVKIIGYNSIPGDEPTGTNRPYINGGSLGLAFTTLYITKNLIYVGSSSAGLSVSGGRGINIKSTNIATGANAEAITSGSGTEVENCEGISYRGNGIEMNGGSTSQLRYSWFHDSNVGISNNSGAIQYVSGSISSANVTAALSQIATNTTMCHYLGNTFYGGENETGIGMNIVTGVTRVIAMNNIFYGFATGVSNADTFSYDEDNYNNYYNNTADVNDVTKWVKGVNDTAVDPSFTSVTQIVGTGAVILSGNRIQDTTKDFTALGVIANATPNVGDTNYVYYSSGSGAGVKGIYAITAITTVTNANDTITVDLALTADATADHGYQITIGNNFLPTGTLPGFPGAFQGGKTTGNITIGAVQKAATAGGTSGTAVGVIGN